MKGACGFEQECVEKFFLIETFLLPFYFTLLYFHRDWVGVQCRGYKIEKNALDGCPGIEKEGRFQRRKAMGRYRL